ncbi:hypothetical protein [Agromyces humatus]|uniref:Uncharacterized protein n=1 Tax=Agromyces humatus TaxID=279573 RepID=A0ABP4X789_9MICO
MGQNRRYGSDLTDLAIYEVVLRPAPISLTPEEVGAADIPPAPSPVDVTAWVRFPEASVEVRARAIAWTDRAVQIEFELRDGQTRRAWVWASAVRRVEPGERRR